MKTALQETDELIQPNPFEDIQHFCRALVRCSVKTRKCKKEQLKSTIKELQDNTSKLQLILERSIKAIDDEQQKRDFGEAMTSSMNSVKQLITYLEVEDVPSQEKTASALSSSIKKLLSVSEAAFGSRQKMI